LQGSQEPCARGLSSDVLVIHLGQHGQR